MTNEQYISKLRSIMELKGNTQKTIRVYSYIMKHFFRFHNKPVHEMTTQDVRSYLLHHIHQGYAPATTNSKHSVLVTFFQEVMEKPEIMAPIPYIKGSTKLPVILTSNEIKQIFDHAPNLKAKTILMVVYSSGLRVSEVTGLKISDIYSKRMQVFVRQGKGKKDRYTILSETALKALRDYYRIYKPVEWLFYPKNYKEKCISTRAVQDHFKHAAATAGITKKVSIHSLRHAFASHLLENDTDLYSIMKLLGHRSLRTTQIYLHLSPAKIHKTVSPLDLEV